MTQSRSAQQRSRTDITVRCGDCDGLGRLIGVFAAWYTGGGRRAAEGLAVLSESAAPRTCRSCRGRGTYSGVRGPRR